MQIRAFSVSISAAVSSRTLFNVYTSTSAAGFDDGTKTVQNLLFDKNASGVYL
jgi:hypothetical protein